MDITIYHVEIEFTEPILGSQPQKDVVEEFINPALAEDEAMALPEKLERATTAFHKVDDEPVFFDYQVKGFLKNAAGVLNSLKTIKEVKALKSKVENTVFVKPRIIPIELPEGGEITFNERPLRAETAQGPRVALARSEQLPVGTKIHFKIEILHGSQISEDILLSILEYGEYCGIGQWRNGGFGRFTFKILNP